MVTILHYIFNTCQYIISLQVDTFLGLAELEQQIHRRQLCFLVRYSSRQCHVAHTELASRRRLW